MRRGDDREMIVQDGISSEEHRRVGWSDQTETET